jgi:hypothetical protein
MARTRRPVPVPPGPGPDPARRFTLRDIAERSGVPHRLVQFWTDSRLLRPVGTTEGEGLAARQALYLLERDDGSASRTPWVRERIAAEHPGRGIAREFSGVEVQIAALLGPLAIGGLPIGRLMSFAYIFREALTGSAPPQQRMVGGAILDNAELRRVLDRAGRGAGANFCIVSFASDGRSLVATLTDENGPPTIDLVKFFEKAEGFPRGDAMTVVISLTERLATLFN